MNTHLLEQLASSDDPQQQLLLQLLQKRTESKKPNAAAKKKRQLKQRMFEFYREKNSELAAACGACECWGLPQCPRCHGEGMSGWREPDPDLFLDYFGPVLHQLGLLVDENETNKTDPNQQPLNGER